jgi:SAM-dependent methyltransferase
MDLPRRHEDAKNLSWALCLCVFVAVSIGAVTEISSLAQTRLPQPGVRYVPSPQSVVDAMLELAHVTANDVVYDLGSGDGRIPITAAHRYGARGVGVEIEQRLVAESNDNAKKAHVADRVTFIHGNLFETDVRPATVVTLFLLPRMLDELLPTLKRELRPGARIVTHGYDFGPAWPPERTQDIGGLFINLWTIK